jgi:predicted flap endonuclease-1-like 5' DNA nuclease
MQSTNNTRGYNSFLQEKQKQKPHSSAFSTPTRDWLATNKRRLAGGAASVPTQLEADAAATASGPLTAAEDPATTSIRRKSATREALALITGAGASIALHWWFDFSIT